MDKKELKENLDSGKEKVKAGAGKVNEKIKGLAFRGMLEKKVSPETRAKFPVLDKIIPLTNYIACGLAVVLVVVVVACSRGGSSSGGGGGRPNPDTDFKYDLTADGSGVKILDYQGNKGGKVVIPEKIEGYPVVAIGDIDSPFNDTTSVFMENSTEEMLRKPESKSVTYGNRTERITSVVIPNTVTYIGAYSFLCCYGLTSITLPKSLTTIGEEAFAYSGLKSVIIPEGVLYIYGGAFNGCDSLTSVTLPESLEELHTNAFSDCSELTTVNLPKSSFLYATDRRSSVERIRTISGKWGEIVIYKDPDNSAFSFCPKLSLATRETIKKTGYEGRF